MTLRRRDDPTDEEIQQALEAATPVAEHRDRGPGFTHHEQDGCLPECGDCGSRNCLGPCSCCERCAASKCDHCSALLCEPHAHQQRDGDGSLIEVFRCLACCAGRCSVERCFEDGCAQ